MAGFMLVNPKTPKRRRTRRKARRAPARRRRRTARRNPVAANPRRRARRRSSPRSYTRRRRARRNPKLLSMRGVTNSIAPAVIGGAGFVALNALFAMAPLPMQLKSGWGATAAKFMVALIVPHMARRAIGSKNADIITLVATGAIAAQQLTKFGAQAGIPGLAAYLPLSEYIPTLGYPNAAPGVDGPLYNSMPLPLDGSLGYTPSDGMSEESYY